MKEYRFFIFSYIFAVLAVIYTSSCNDQFTKGVYIATTHEYMLNIESTDLQSIPAGGGTYEISIEASYDVNWEIKDLPDWISASLTEGKGSKTIVFNIQPNNSQDESRTHIFFLESLNTDWPVSLPIAITQLQDGEIFSVSPKDSNSLTLSAEGGSIELNVHSNIYWTVSCDEEFISFSRHAGNGDAKLEIIVAPYSSGNVQANRTASVYFKDANEKKVLEVITITQIPIEVPSVSETIDVEFSNNEESKNFVLDDIKGGYLVKSNAAWLSIVKNRNDKTNVTLSVSANINDDKRTSTAYIVSENSNEVIYIFRVTQAGSMLNINPKSLDFNANGGSEKVSVNTNSPWTLSNINDWIVAQENSKYCTITVGKNTSVKSRTGKIVFYRLDSDSNIVGDGVELKISQKSSSFSVDSKSLRFGPEASSQNLHIETDSDWSLTTNNNWIKTSSSKGTGDRTVSVSVTENPSTSDRTGKLTLNCLDSTIEITIVQESAYINTPSTAISISSNGGYASISLSSNVSWTASSSSSWLSVSPSSGNGKTTLQLYAPANSSSDSRSAVVTIKSQLSDIKINVTQKAPSLSLSTSSLTFESSGGTSSSIIVDADGDFSITPSVSWLTVNKSSNSFKVTASENKSSSRQGKITVSLNNTSISKTVSVTQKAYSPPVTNPPSVSLTSASAYNWAIKMAASVSTNGNTITEVGFVWNTGNTSSLSDPTVNNCSGKKIASLSGTKFEATTPQIYNYTYVKVRAYVKTSNNSYYYSGSQTVKP